MQQKAEEAEKLHAESNADIPEHDQNYTESRIGDFILKVRKGSDGK
jgi:hypothetical protein